jgi:hypothetical protein
MARHHSNEPRPLPPLLVRLIQAAEDSKASAHTIALRTLGALALWLNSIRFTRTSTTNRATEGEVNASPARGLNSVCDRCRHPRSATGERSALFAPLRGTR